MRALTWNLYHGRSPSCLGRSLLDEFAGVLASWDWDVALLQEVPPWWPPRLARESGAQARWVPTSRNGMPGVRRAIASRNPDLLKANGGGANAILVRGTPVLEHRSALLTRVPERRVVHGVRLFDGWVVNVHASTPDGMADSLRALAAALTWAGGMPLLFGGDLNVKRPVLPGMVRIAGNHVDHLFTEGRRGRDATVLERGALSDHPPVAVTV